MKQILHGFVNNSKGKKGGSLVANISTTFFNNNLNGTNNNNNNININ